MCSRVNRMLESVLVHFCIFLHLVALLVPLLVTLQNHFR